MNNILIKCPHCNKIFKVTKAKEINGNHVFITDFNDVFFPETNYNYKCINCKKEFDVSNNTILTEDWIADMLFKIKGS